MHTTDGDTVRSIFSEDKDNRDYTNEVTKKNGNEIFTFKSFTS